MVAGALGRVWPSFADIKHCAGSILRGTGLGAVLGVLLIALLGRGHVLIEDVPGVGKTTLAINLAFPARMWSLRLALVPVKQKPSFYLYLHIW